MKISVALQGYWLDKQLDFSPHTVRSYQRVFKLFADYLGDREIEKITADDIRRFLFYLRTEKKHSRRTVHDSWVPLSGLWTWAEINLEIPHIIRGKVKSPEFTQLKIMPFDVDDIRALIKAAEYENEWLTRNGRRTRSKRATAAREKAMILTLVDSGLRVSEMCALTVGDYDASRGRLHVRHGKGDKERYVVVGNRTRKAIWLYMATREGAKPSSPLFASRNDTHLDRNNVRHILTKIGIAAGVDNVHPHRFRHTYAINFLRNGGSPLLLQELLGHEQLDTVRIYVQLAEQDIDKAQAHSPADEWKL
jgi:integrase/recombinase XerD